MWHSAKLMKCFGEKGPFPQFCLSNPKNCQCLVSKKTYLGFQYQSNLFDFIIIKRPIDKDFWCTLRPQLKGVLQKSNSTTKMHKVISTMAWKCIWKYLK